MLIFKSLMFAGMLAIPSPVVVSADESLRADQLVTRVPLRELMQAVEAGPGMQLAIGHPGGEAGTVRAERLRAALVALGLSSARIALVPQPLDEPVLIISLEKTAP